MRDWAPGLIIAVQQPVNQVSHVGDRDLVISIHVGIISVNRTGITVQQVVD
jgi:hypothetical protein